MVLASGWKIFLVLIAMYLEILEQLSQLGTGRHLPFLLPFEFFTSREKELCSLVSATSFIFEVPGIIKGGGDIFVKEDMYDSNSALVFGIFNLLFP